MRGQPCLRRWARQGWGHAESFKNHHIGQVSLVSPCLCLPGCLGSEVLPCGEAGRKDFMSKTLDLWIFFSFSLFLLITFKHKFLVASGEPAWLSGGCSAMRPPPAKSIWQRGLRGRLTVEAHTYGPPACSGLCSCHTGVGKYSSSGVWVW